MSQRELVGILTQPPIERRIFKENLGHMIKNKVFEELSLILLGVTLA